MILHTQKCPVCGVRSGPFIVDLIDGLRCLGCDAWAMGFMRAVSRYLRRETRTVEAASAPVWAPAVPMPAGVH